MWGLKIGRELKQKKSYNPHFIGVLLGRELMKIGRELMKIGRELMKIGRELMKIGREITIFSGEVTNNREGIENAGEKEKKGIYFRRVLTIYK